MGRDTEIDNLALVSCRSPYLDSDKVYPPLGLLYLKAAVDKELPYVNVDLIDDYDLNDPMTFEGYDAVGISTMTPQREEASRILSHVRTYRPDQTVIIGGPHAFHYQDEVAEMDFDYIVTRDGQRSLVNILRGNADRIQTDVMSKAEWGNQPRPDRTSGKATKFLSGYSYSLQGRKSATMLTATGCPMECTFCEDARTPSRWSPLEKISNELDDIQLLGNKGVYLFDDLFAIAMPKVKPIAEELAKRDLVYRCNGQANYFTKWGEDFAKLLADTGCVEIAFGHESGSQRILDAVKKNTTVKENYQSVEFAKKHGIKVKSFLMLGLPGEDASSIAETEKFIRESGVDDFQLAVYYPYRGTAIRDAIDSGLDVDLLFEGEGLGAYGQAGGSSEAVVRTEQLSSKDLLEIRDKLVVKYKPGSHKLKWTDGFFDQWNFENALGIERDPNG